MSSSPNALCFGHEFPTSGVPCLVQIGLQGLTVVFTSDGQEQQEDIPFTALSISVGGLDHDHLVLKWPSKQGERLLYLKDAELIRTFRRVAPPSVHIPFEQAASVARLARWRRMGAWGVAFGILLTGVAGLWWGSDLLVALAVERIPVEWERKLGEAAYRELLARQDLVKEGPAVSAIQEMTRRLVEQIPHNPYKFEVTVVKSDVVNAFALPGGYIVVFTGLMQNAACAEEVAGVLGHEIHHVLQRHGLERIVKRLGLVVAASILVGDQRGFAGLMKQFSVEFVGLTFDREQETRADIAGLHLLYDAKIDPFGMIRFFERLSANDEGRMEWLSTHPMSRGRAERLTAELAAMPQLTPVPFTFDWAAVRESLGAPPSAEP
ncbi:MAG: M48 family metallopeptidase [Nitrospira sp.]|nr:M48 family metallopeptidase [Nitrospira sp.]